MSSRSKRPDDESAHESGDRSGVSRRSFLQGGAASALVGGVASAARAAAETSGPATVEVIGAHERAPIELVVNGVQRTASVEPRVTLLDVLRDHLDVTGPKKVCDRGTCGACTVLENGRLVYSCSRLAVQAHGHEIETVEALGTPESMHPLQAAFVEHDAQQCGFCTPGFIVAMAHLLEHNPEPDDDEIDRGLSGNLCRCGTYQGLREVARSVVEVATRARPAAAGGKRRG